MIARYFLVEVVEGYTGPTPLPNDSPTRADVVELPRQQGADLMLQTEQRDWTMRSARSIPLAVATAFEEMLR